MDIKAAIVGLMIAIAGVADVSLGTMRTISVVQGRAFLAWALGFCEVLIWRFAVSQVLQTLPRRSTRSATHSVTPREIS